MGLHRLGFIFPRASGLRHETPIPCHAALSRDIGDRRYLWVKAGRFSRPLRTRPDQRMPLRLGPVRKVGAPPTLRARKPSGCAAAREMDHVRPVQHLLRHGLVKWEGAAVEMMQH